MPTYEYECKSCGHNFEVFQSMSDPPIKKCTDCGMEVRRLIFGGAGVIFKGSGFYVTDKNKAAGKAGGTGRESGKPETPGLSQKSEGCASCSEAPKCDFASNKNKTGSENAKNESKSA